MREIIWKAEQGWSDQAILGTIVIGWVIFSSIKFEINPIFFGTSSFVLILLVVLKKRTSLEINKDHFVIYSIRLIDIFSTKKEISIKNIEEVVIELRKFSTKHLFYDSIGHLKGSFGVSPNIIRIKTGEKIWVEFQGSGIKKDNEKMKEALISLNPKIEIKMY